VLLRPAKALWFEVLVARKDLASALASLAAGGEVELESQQQESVAELAPRWRAMLDEYRRLAQRFALYWPPASGAFEPNAEPETIGSAALTRLRAWAVVADPLIIQLQQLTHERIELIYLQRLLAQSGASLAPLDLVLNAGPVLAGRIYLLEKGSGPLQLPDTILAQRVDCLEYSYLVAVGARAQLEKMDEGLSALKARRLALPTTLAAASAEPLATRLKGRLEQIDRTIGQLEAQLGVRDVEHDLAAALADMALIGWFADAVPEFVRTDHFVRITGWTSDSRGEHLRARLGASAIHYLIHLAPPPPRLARPIVLRNPRWIRPFESFARLLGVPGANEADPSVILAVLAPLMFGFMFGDVGQGGVLVLAGLALRKRYAAAELLIAGGIAAMVFGSLFGSVFAQEGLIRALWLQPLRAPLTLLEVGLAAGSVVILLGLALDALESYWGGEAQRWWASRAGLVLSYLAALGCVADRRAAWLVPVGIAWYCAGEVAGAKHRAAQLGASLGEAVETLLQLLVNTLSFVRVGAFALAHAGLAAAINALCAGIGPRWLAILGLILGNAVLILIEGLVVGIQTTRLVLFEFFIRFLRGSGRALKPLLALPVAIPMQLSRKSS
jgi:V/A-type H+-transporting ATPase subunit I